MTQTAAQEALAEHLAVLHEQIAPRKLSDIPGQLIPVRPVDGDRVQEHPSGYVMVRFSPSYTLWFETVRALDDFLESLDRERVPGRDPWVPSVVADLTERRR